MNANKVIPENLSVRQLWEIRSDKPAFRISKGLLMSAFRDQEGRFEFLKVGYLARWFTFRLLSSTFMFLLIKILLLTNH